MVNDHPLNHMQQGNSPVSGTDSVVKADTVSKAVFTVKEEDIFKTAKKDLTTSLKEEPGSLQAPAHRKRTSPLKEYNDWLAIILIISVVITGFLRISSMKFLRELFTSAIYSQVANKMYTSVNIRNSKPSLILHILFFINTGVFIFEALVFYDQSIFGQKGLSLLMIIWALLLGFSISKFLLYKMTGYVFDTANPTGEYLFNASLLSKVYAILLLPVIVFIPFINSWMVPNLIKFGVGMFIILYFLQLFRGGRIILQNTFSVFYLFLYFCALEILLLVILYKILFS